MEKENDIDSLARMVADGFNNITVQMNDRFDGVEGRLEKLEGRFDALEKTVQDTNKRIDTIVVPTLDAHAHRIKKLEEQIA